MNLKWNIKRNFVYCIRVLTINILILFSLLGMLLLAPPALFKLYMYLSKVQIISTNPDVRSLLELYSSYDWAEKHFLELNELSASYYDFVTWKREDYIGKTVIIKNGLRRTSNSSSDEPGGEKFWFFGGSTTWGTGVDDEHTYPSLFSNYSGSYTTNFGETAYIARQSYANLNNYLVKNGMLDLSGINVVFYDGVNDVAHRCRSEINGLGTAREAQIRNELKFTSYERFGIGKTLNQLIDFLTVVHKRYLLSDTINQAFKMYGCASNEKRAEEVASTLVNTWVLASDLVKARGGKFTAILQPVAYIGNAEISYLNLTMPDDKALYDQYQAVYPLIAEAAAAKNIRFLDYTKVFDGCTECYIDFCHTSPQANEILVAKLVSELTE